jgi:CRISPR/Cas system CSM-associated protein Csm3 (group 7 of RAMP superfamily)
MKKRYIAHITLEADTPLKIGSADSDFMKDSPIQRDWNGLPMILGTSIAGVLRKDFEGDADDIFGKANGSKVIFSNALLVDENSRVNEELLLSKSPFLKLFDKLPQREHTAITQKGVAKEHSKFDEEVVYKGTRFRFALEMLEDKSAFTKLLEMLQSPSFRVGGGSTKGFGKFKVIEILSSVIDTAEALATYSSSLNSTEGSRVELSTNIKPINHTSYSLTIEPDEFFMFGSGFGDDEADQIPVVEKIIDYQTKALSANHILIPASSLKGAIAHRTAYHYNLQNGLFVGDNEARLVISELFGEAKNSKKEIEGSRGKVLFSDLFKLDREESKVFDHVAIDRFTGGGIDGALFQEKTTAQSDVWELEILLENGVDDVFVEAFERALDDVCSGMLALGGATTKGHGVFSGSWSKL